MAQINNIDLLNETQKQDLIYQVKGMGEYWVLVECCWYSDGSRAYIVTDKDGITHPSTII